MKFLKYLLYTVIALVLLGVGGFVYLGQSSQSGTAPGMVAGQLAPCPDSPNCVSSEAGTAEEKLVDMLDAGTWDAIPGAITEMGGVVTATEESYLAAEFTSATFGFVDDVEFRLAEDGVHVRSGSRVGHSDAGVNAARIAELRGNLGG
jgi:uncharacterized protein (DUF1499 family)